MIKQKIQRGILLGFVAVLSFASAAQAKPQQVKMNAAQRAKLDKFFSNFTETSLSSFERNKVSDQVLIGFAISYIFDNKSRVTQKGRVAASQVDASAAYFFGRKIKKHRSIEGNAFKNGFYEGGDAILERQIPVFSRVKKLVSLGDQNYLVSVENYVGLPGAKDGDEKPRVDQKVSATIRQVTSQGKPRFILTSYKILWQWQFPD